MGNLLVADLHLHRQCGDLVRTGYHVILGSIFEFGQGGAYGNLNTLGRRFVDTHVVHTAHEVDDIAVEVVTGSFDGFVGHNTAERDNGNLCRTTAYINDHAAFRCFNIDTDADSCSHRFVQHVDITASGVLATIADGANLHLGTARRDTYNHADSRREEAALLGNHLYQSADHHLAGLEVGNHTFLQRADGANLLAAAANHLLCLAAYSQTLVISHRDGDHAGLVHNYLILIHDKGVSGAEVYCNFLCKREH